MDAATGGPTLLRPEEARRPSRSTGPRSQGLPTDLVQQATGRLHALAQQALGAATVDNRADIYATGCVAYWLLTGQLVFTGDTPMRLLLHHAHTQPDPPSLRTEFPIPQALDALILSCLAKNPADRPQTARELVGRVEAIHLTSVWSEQRAREWWERHQPR